MHVRSLAVLVALAAFGCDMPSESAPLDLSAGVPLTSVEYRLAWRLDGAQLDSVAGVAVDTNTGYYVEVDSAYLVAYRASLAQCDAVTAPVYWHGEDIDPSSAGNLVESFGMPGSRAFDAEFPEAVYCRAHYLVARADGDTSSLPDDTGMQDVSIAVDGRFRAPGSDELVPFSLRSSEATGVLVDFEQSLGEVSTSELPAHAIVTVERSLGTLFDDVDFQAGSSEDMAWGALRNLRLDARVVVDLSPAR